MTAFEAQCGETRFPEICGECLEMVRWMGPRKRQRQVCGCPEKQKDAVKSARSRAAVAKGKRGEKKAEGEWNNAGWIAQRTAGSGSTGSRNAERIFDTDLVVRGPMELKVEVKEHASIPMKGLVKAVELKGDFLPVEAGAAVSLEGMLAGSDVMRLQETRKPAYYFCRADKLLALAALAAEAKR